MSVPPRTRYFRSKLSMAIVGPPAGPTQRPARLPAAAAGGGRGRPPSGPRPLPVARFRERYSPAPGRVGNRRHLRDRAGPCRRVRTRTVQPVEPVGAEQDEVDHQRQPEEERERRPACAAGRREARCATCRFLPSDDTSDATRATCWCTPSARVVAARPGQPGTPHPGEDSGRPPRSAVKTRKLVMKMRVELLGFGLGQPREATRSVSPIVAMPLPPDHGLSAVAAHLPRGATANAAGSVWRRHVSPPGTAGRIRAQPMKTKRDDRAGRRCWPRRRSTPRCGPSGAAAPTPRQHPRRRRRCRRKIAKRHREHEAVLAALLVRGRAQDMLGSSSAHLP